MSRADDLRAMIADVQDELREHEEDGGQGSFDPDAARVRLVEFQDELRNLEAAEAQQTPANREDDPDNGAQVVTSKRKTRRT